MMMRLLLSHKMGSPYPPRPVLSQKKDFQEAKTQFDRDRESDEQRKEASFIIPRWIGLGLSHEGLREYDKAMNGTPEP